MSANLKLKLVGPHPLTIAARAHRLASHTARRAAAGSIV